VVNVRLNESGEILNLYKPIGSAYKSITPQLAVELAKQELELLTDKPNTTLYRTITSFSYIEKDALKDFDFGNVLIEANLPYCLLVPNFTEMLVSIPELNIKALVIPEKIWTNRAREEEKKSDRVDYYARNVPLYYKKITILGPRMPLEPEMGWEHYITGRNIEKIKDRNGIFRYSKVYIQLNLHLQKNVDSFSEALREKLFIEIKEKSLAAINRVIDNYRDITSETHVRRLGHININSVYFMPQNVGYYMSEYNITAAMINRSGNEIDELKTRLAKGEKPELYKLLLLNAKSSFDSKDYTTSIVESFQALEIFLENYLVSEFKKRGDKESDYKKTLDKHWRTKERLNDVLGQLKHTTLNKQVDLWDSWCLRYDGTRNEVIHAGREPTEKETINTLDINEKVIHWILTL